MILASVRFGKDYYHLAKMKTCTIFQINQPRHIWDLKLVLIVCTGATALFLIGYNSSILICIFNNFILMHTASQGVFGYVECVNMWLHHTTLLLIFL